MGWPIVTVEDCFYGGSQGRQLCAAMPCGSFEKARREALHTSYSPHLMQSKKMTGVACPNPELTVSRELKNYYICHLLNAKHPLTFCYVSKICLLLEVERTGDSLFCDSQYHPPIDARELGILFSRLHLQCLPLEGESRPWRAAAGRLRNSTSALHWQLEID